MKSIGIDELKKIQLDIIQEVHDFCVSHGITYSLADGSLLGAIRHNGYIPWDDDIDIYLLRDDFKKLQKVFPKKYKGHLDLLSLETDDKWNRPYAKIHDTRTIMEEETSAAYPNLGINIDVYPIDKVPDEEILWQQYNKRRRLLQKMFEAKFVKTNRQRPLWKNIIIVFSKLLILPLSTRRYAELLSSIAQKYNDTEALHVFETVQGLHQKHPFLKSDFDSVVLHSFEDRMLNVMSGYDDCLRNGYGDYMQLPPEDKRVSHHAFKAYWK